MKGLKYLLEALAKLRTEREVSLVVIGRKKEGGVSARTHRRAGPAATCVDVRDRRARGAHHRAVLRGRGGGGARRSTRASRCPPSRPCPAACRWWPPPAAPCPRWSAPTTRPPCCVPPGRLRGPGRPHRHRPRRPRAAGPHRRRRPPAGHRPLDVAPHRGGHRRALPGPAGRDGPHPAPPPRRRAGRAPLPRPAPTPHPAHRAAASRSRRPEPMLTVDYDKLGLRPGDLLLDLGCGFGRHAFEGFRRGARVVACDMALDELVEVRGLFEAMVTAGEVAPDSLRRRASTATPPACPFADGTFDRIIASEVMEHIPDDLAALDELTRVLKPGRHHGRHHPGLAAREGVLGAQRRVPRPRASRAATCASTPRTSCARRCAAPACDDGAAHHAHALHSPYWWLKCAVGTTNDDFPLVKLLPPPAGVGHHQAAGGDPHHRAAAQPGAGQEPGRLRHQADRHGASRPPTASRAALRPPGDRREAARCHCPRCPGILTAAEVGRTVDAIADVAAAQRHDPVVPRRPRRPLEPRRGGHGPGHRRAPRRGRAGLPVAGRPPAARRVVAPVLPGRLASSRTSSTPTSSPTWPPACGTTTCCSATTASSRPCGRSSRPPSTSCSTCRRRGARSCGPATPTARRGRSPC